MKKIVISGYHGFGNIGDEAILKVMITEFNKMNVDITVLSQNPEETKQKFNVNTVDRTSIFKIIKTIKKSDILVSGGGSLLQESTSRKSIYYYLFIYFIALICKKKTIIYSQGIGPIYRNKSKKMIKYFFNKASFISVRDRNSEKELIRYGIDKKEIKITADPVMGFDYDYSKKKYNEKKKIGFAVKSSKKKDVSDDFVKIIKELHQKGYECILIPFHYQEDLSLIHTIEDKLDFKVSSIKEKKNVNDMMDIIADVDLLVGVRLHSLIFAVVTNTPLIGISYDPKIDSFLESIEEKAICDIDHIIVDDVIRNIEEYIDNKYIKERLVKNLNKYKILLSDFDKDIEELLVREIYE